MVQFSGTVQSDFLKLVGIDSDKKSDYVDYSSHTFDSLRSSLIEYVKALYPLDYNNFVESDLGMMLIELVAYMGAVTSFKSDLLANESFIRTARNRNNVKKLLELIGVRMKGPISAAANAKLTLASTPWSLSTDYMSIPLTSRAKQITSPEDGAPLTFTLYKVLTNGQVDLENSQGTISLYETEAADYDATVTGTSNTFTNLVLLEGTFVKESGVFTSPEAIKTIELSQFPVIEGSVQIYVEGQGATSGSYAQVDNIFIASGSDSKVFQIISNDEFKSVVVFGDGNIGISPTTGDSYTVFYRVGGGSRGNISKEVINVPLSLTKEPGSVSVNSTLENISQGTGGSDAETIEHAKKYAPLTFRRQDRLVTLYDFKTFANSYITQYGSVGKATAITRRAYGSANIIDIYVLEKASNTQFRKATPTFKKLLLDAMNEKKMLTDEIVIVDGLIRTVDLVITIRIDKRFIGNEELVKLKARDKILAFMNSDNNDFGKALISSDLVRKVFEIPEVRFATVDNLDEVTRVDFNEVLQLNNLTINCVAI